MAEAKVWFSEETRCMLESEGIKEGVSIRVIATKALQSIGIVHAYNREGKVFVELDGLTKSVLSVIEIPRTLHGKLEVYLNTSKEVYGGLTRIAKEMGFSVEDVFHRAVGLYGAIRILRCRGSAFGIATLSPRVLYAELFIPGITVL
ncbi:MAG: hypothetical protein WAP23_02600 [Candidatus Spechtbacterales bacterium]